VVDREAVVDTLREVGAERKVVGRSFQWVSIVPDWWDLAGMGAGRE